MKKTAKKKKPAKFTKKALKVLVHSQSMILPHGYKIVKAKR
jgi:hypothetical protein